MVQTPVMPEHSGQRRQIYFVSPIPPVPTGPADYMQDFIRALSAEYRERFAFFVACDPRDFSPLPSSYEGCAVVPYTHISPRPSDVFIYFLANNPWHRYVRRMLADHETGKAYAVLHDIASSMDALSMCLEKDCGFTPADLPAFFAREFGGGADLMARMLICGQLPQLAQYLALAQSIPLERANAIIVHSHYGKLKILAERSFGTPVPSVFVLQMPQRAPMDAALLPVDAPSSNQVVKPPKEEFRIGVFGLVSPHKRVLQVMKALRRYLDGLPISQRNTVHADIVGGGDEYLTAVMAYVRNNELEDNVTVHGYVNYAKMNQLMNESHMIFNLRFPSCGETSATLANMSKLPGIVVTSDYAALREEPADFKVSVGPNELDELVESIRLTHQSYRKTGTVEKQEKLPRGSEHGGQSGKLSVTELMDALVSEPLLTN